MKTVWYSVILPWRVAKDTATLVLVSIVALKIFRRAWEASYDTLLTFCKFLIIKNGLKMYFYEP